MSTNTFDAANDAAGWMAREAWRRGMQRSAARREAGRRCGLGSARAGHWRWAAPVSSATPSVLPSAFPRKETEMTAGSAPLAHMWKETERTTMSMPPAPLPFPAGGAAVVRIPDALLRAMRESACNAGRSESEVWAEAAREWLLMRGVGDGPEPTSPASAPRPLPRSWAGIDALVAVLRAPHAHAHAHPADAA
jgi:hypothetical protein